MAVALYAEERSTGTVPFLTPVTARAVVTVCVRLPDVPVIVIVEVASFDESAAVRVILLALALLAGLNEAFTPAGTSDTLRLTPALKLPRRVTVTVVVPVPPLATDTLSAFIRSAKSSAPASGAARRS